MREWLVQLRKERGIRQTEIAERAGITQASYSNIERDKLNPRVETAKKIATALGFEWTRFFEETAEHREEVTQ